MGNNNPWYLFAIEDYNSIKELVGKQLIRSVLFHAQQFFEKTLKGILFEKGISPPKTHDLSYLAKLTGITFSDFGISNSDLEFLTSVYIETRYPPDLGLLPDGEPTSFDEKDAINISEKLYSKLDAIFKAAKNKV
jgi:HEPN domain-containing protein